MGNLNFLQHLANGISLGSLYALIAIGYTMVYGILRLINFAHGDIFMLGAYITYYGILFTSIPWWLVFIFASIFTGFIGLLLEKIAYRPLRESPRITILISAIGASFFLQNFGIVVFGGRPKAFPVPNILNKVIRLGGVSVGIVTFVIPTVTIILLLGLTYFITKTKTGMAMRALSKDYETASLMGIDINRIISITFFIGSFLAAVGGVMWGTKYPQLMPLMGVMPGLKCFIAAVIGGIGNITGAVIGGFILGLGEILLIAFLPNLTGYRDAFAFVLLIIILLVKPTGLMGEKITEKV
ncbi:leucine/isoleucine/valine transporter subunit; membrane component of ABC superfamily [[Clostridium] ultunense Esp]|uniref:Leucine/isoleucine/valine transporter subunit membrane component of ABC superfamily n=1 Tax=[Clostridium] ultunense Esp TaxID=1288971 RepID=M1Z552_9FIRM|nr:branched-chain amino acid ABC transporter permease [Schnuerera ultunensis]CCQ93146.1 leucine/isoleucine/valine transporter subunit; membrane component of ABC superfamily [[Clostridium] ultunense Esp]SHD76412.1 leucine/isoleucine/valine transporter subunit; membrane component of ABC superfamily [[Clostridium] ultunense Esp]